MLTRLVVRTRVKNSLLFPSGCSRSTGGRARFFAPSPHLSRPPSSSLVLPRAPSCSLVVRAQRRPDTRFLFGESHDYRRYDRFDDNRRACRVVAQPFEELDEPVDRANARRSFSSDSGRILFRSRSIFTLRRFSARFVDREDDVSRSASAFADSGSSRRWSRKPLAREDSRRANTKSSQIYAWVANTN